MTAIARGFLIGFLGSALVVALIIFWPTREQAAPTPTPRPVATPTPEPFEPPEPEDDDLDVPTLLKITVCHCKTPYGPCVEHRMSPRAARLHAIAEDHDLFHRGCASAAEEDLALRRVLLRPEQIETNTRNTLALADRAARREREVGR